jgi:hypothetical protein
MLSPGKGKQLPPWLTKSDGCAARISAFCTDFCFSTLPSTTLQHEGLQAAHVAVDCELHEVHVVTQWVTNQG